MTVIEDDGLVDRVVIDRCLDIDPPDTMTRAEYRAAVVALIKAGHTYDGTASILDTSAKSVHRVLATVHPADIVRAQSHYRVLEMTA